MKIRPSVARDSVWTSKSAAASARKACKGMLALAVLMGAASMGGCLQMPEPFDPNDHLAWERDANHATRPGAMYPGPTTTESQQLPTDTSVPSHLNEGGGQLMTGPTVAMSLQQIIHRAVANNLDVRVASYDTAIDQTRTMEAVGHFDPTFFTQIQYQKQDKPTGGVSSSIPTRNASYSSVVSNQFTAITTDFLKSDTATLQTGVRQYMAAGGQIELKEQLQYTYNNPPQAILNPNYDASLVLTITQPLLQNAGVAVNEARINISINNQAVSLMDFRKTLEETVLKIEQTYWQLVQAQEDVGTYQRLVDESRRLEDILVQRRNVDVNGIQLEETRSQTAFRRVLLNQKQQQVLDLSSTLKSLMNDPAYPVAGNTRIVPIDTASDAAVHFSRDEQIDTALQNRLELGQQDYRIKSSEIAVMVAGDNMLPKLDLTASVSNEGLQRSLGNAIRQQGDFFNHIGYQLGLNLEIPIGDRAARAVWDRALLQRHQTIAQYADDEEKVVLDVDVAIRQVEASWERITFARDARVKSESTLKLVKDQRDAGAADALSPDSVFRQLQYQQELAQNEQAEHQALNDYNFAIANLEKAKGTILRYDHVMMEEETLPIDLQSRKGWNPTGNPRY